MNAKDKEAFEKFLLAEYEHIANAHFNAVETISEFFKHYVTMIGLPLAAVPIIIKILPERARAIENLKGYESFIIMASLIVASIGFCMMIYIVSLHKVSLLYAKTVNGVRNYFYEIAALDSDSEAAVRVLPRSIKKPRYFRKSFMSAIVAFGLLDGSYPSLAIFLTSLSRGSTPGIWTISAIVSTLVASVLIHAWAYRRYLRSND